MVDLVGCDNPNVGERNCNMLASIRTDQYLQRENERIYIEKRNLLTCREEEREREMGMLML